MAEQGIGTPLPESLAQCQTYTQAAEWVKAHRGQGQHAGSFKNVIVEQEGIEIAESLLQQVEAKTFTPGRGLSGQAAGRDAHNTPGNKFGR